MKSNKPNKCWYCSNLGSCMKLKPCEDFIKYNYQNIPPYTIEQVAKLCKVTSRTIYRWFAKSVNYALYEIKRLTGLKFDYVEQENGKHMLIRR